MRAGTERTGSKRPLTQKEGIYLQREYFYRETQRTD